MTKVNFQSVQDVVITSLSTNDILQWDGSNWTNQTLSGGGNALTSGKLSQFAATTSAELAGVLSDEHGASGVFPRVVITSIAAVNGV